MTLEEMVIPFLHGRRVVKLQTQLVNTRHGAKRNLFLLVVLQALFIYQTLKQRLYTQHLQHRGVTASISTSVHQFASVFF